MVLLKQFLGSLARVWLGVLAGWFVRRGYFAAKEADTYVEAAADWLVPVAIVAVPSIWAWLAAQARLLKERRFVRLVVRAAAAPAGTPLSVIEHADRVGIPMVVSRNVQVGQPADCDDEGPRAA